MKRKIGKVKCRICGKTVYKTWFTRHMSSHDVAVRDVSILPPEVTPALKITTMGDELVSVKEIEETIAELERQIAVLREAGELLKRI